MSVNKTDGKDMPEKKQHKKSVRDLIMRGAIVALLIVGVALCGESYFLYKAGNQTVSWDAFNFSNALFTGLAFMVLTATVILQWRELGLQRKELKLTREELQGQKEQLSNQNKTLELRNFENTFFELLRLQNETIRFISINKETGRDCFIPLYAQLTADATSHFLKNQNSNLHDNSASNKKGKIKKKELEHVNAYYSSFFTKYQSSIGHYFRSLYNIIKFVHGSKRGLKEKRFYVNLVRAQLSSDELLLLFYNALQSENKKFKDLIEKYSLLKTVPEDRLYDQQSIGDKNIKEYPGYPHSSLYKTTAYRKGGK